MAEARHSTQHALLRYLAPIAGGLKSRLRLPERSYKGTGGTNSARYCYSVWLRHLRLCTPYLSGWPRDILEIGPGDSLGTGLCALLSGSERLVSIDYLHHSDPTKDLAIFDNLCQLFRAREPIPGEDEFPRVHPRVASYSFPADLLPDERLRAALEPARIARLRAALESAYGGRNCTEITYIAPWSSETDLGGYQCDLLLGQGVLQDIQLDDPRMSLRMAARRFRAWTRPGGILSQHVDCSAPGFPEVWNEHWRYPAFLWRQVIGARPYYVNRVPYSGYERLLSEVGFEKLALNAVRERQGLPRTRVAAEFKTLPEEDFRIEAFHAVFRRT